MVDPLEVSPWDNDDCIIAFDGRVLEVFWHFRQDVVEVDAMRIHVRQLTVTVSGPDRKGRRKVRFAGRTRLTFTASDLEEPQWTALQPLLDALRAAGAKFDS